MRDWLIDTGPIIAFLDSEDAAHDEVAACWAEFTGANVTTGAVITEVMHFVAGVPNGPRLLADLLAHANWRIYDACQPAEVAAAAGLMTKYADTPMDFADATLVLLAGALDLRSVLTLDRRGFTTYRTKRDRSFQLVLEN